MHNSTLFIQKTRSRIKELVRQFGASRAATLLGLSRETVIRICAGVGVRRGSMVIAEQAIRARSEDRGEAVSK